MQATLNIGTEKALQKIRRFCAYRERNHQEVKQKLYSYGLYKNQVEELLSVLISENYCNEERYALAYAGGKLRMNGWGKRKIEYALKGQQVSDYCIKKAMQMITLEDYENKAERLFLLRWNALRKEKNPKVRKKKLINYMLQKGFENYIIYALIDKHIPE